MRWRISKLDGLWRAQNPLTGLTLWFANKNTAYGFLEDLERAQ